MPKKTDLQEKMERARRLAGGLSDPVDRARLDALANDYQRQIDEAESSGELTDEASDAAPNEAAPEGVDVATSEPTGEESLTAADDQSPTSD